MSMSTPASSASFPASARDPATPWFMSSATAVQSLTTKPWKPHSRRSTVVMSQGLAVLGMPPISLKEVMTVPAPASTALRYRSEEHTSELQSPYDIVCRLLLEKINDDGNMFHAGS